MDGVVPSADTDAVKDTVQCTAAKKGAGADVGTSTGASGKAQHSAAQHID